MTIATASTKETSGESQEEIVVHSGDSYISGDQARLNHKWQYDPDTETFLLGLPKVYFCFALLCFALFRFPPPTSLPRANYELIMFLHLCLHLHLCLYFVGGTARPPRR
mmetsp:Transcript_25113/g.37574  ORF Transcript_25113/g.37574 Transcript_25113/m.37574 type:complete len:109 (+) Transcript_25113:63-389(+)